MNAVKKCYASIYTTDVFAVRKSQWPGMGVIIQTQIDSLVSGVVVTQNPITNNKHEIFIESLWGQGNSKNK